MKNAVTCSIALLGLAIGSPAGAAAKADAPASAAPKGAAKQLALLCQAQNRSKYLLVDFAQKTVNGVKAVITDAEITWSSEEFDAAGKRKRVIRNQLNRIEGTYRGWPEGEGRADSATVYGCDRAPAAKF